MTLVEEYRYRLIERALTEIMEAGFPDINKENIFTNKIYSVMFKILLKGYLGEHSGFDVAIQLLLEEIK